MSYTKTTWVDNTTPINETNLNKIESGIKNNDINIGEENYDNTKTYEVGDIVRYNEKIYKCITAITTAENFDISKWEQTNIVEIVQSEKSKIYELIEAISTPIVGEGENITLNDTAEKRFENFDIEGNSEQATRSGKNLLELIEGTYSDRGITAVVKNGIVTLNGTATGTSFVGINLLKNFNLITENAYRLSAFNTEVVGNSSDNLCSLRLNGEVTKETTLNKTNSNKAITGNFLLTYITIRTAQGITYNNFVIKPQLELGNGTDTWEQGGVSPSPDYPSEVECCGDNGSINEVICNKNILDEIYQKNITVDGVEFKQNGNEVTLNGTATREINFNIKLWNSANGGFPFETGTYSILGGLNGSVRLRIFRVKDSGNPLVDIGKGSNGKLEKGEDYRFWLTINNGTVCNNLKLKLMLAHGIVTEYTEHQSQSYTIPTQQPMRAIGNVRDKFILKENGKWYERHYTYRKIFDGNEGITINTKDTESTLFQLVCTDCFVPTNLDKIYAKSNQLKGTSVNLCISEITGKNTVALGHNTNRLWLRVSSEIVGTGTDTERLTQLKSWLEEQYNAGTPVYVDYVLEEPLDIECTSEQTEILNQIYIKAKSYKGVTHIYSNDEVSPNCYVEAVKDLTTLIQ